MTYRPSNIDTNDETIRRMQALATELGVKRERVYGAAFKVALENEERVREVAMEEDQ